MATRYRLTPELRKKLKRPIGTLIRGSFNETIKKLKDLVEKESPQMIISVGDNVSKNLTENNMFPKLSIVDNKVMRKRIQPIALATIQEALEHNRRVKIVVDGEEDLLTLAAVLYAPENSFVVYGQPLEGVVVIKVTEQKKEEVTEVLKAMEIFRKAK